MKILKMKKPHQYTKNKKEIDNMFSSDEDIEDEKTPPVYKKPKDKIDKNVIDQINKFIRKMDNNETMYNLNKIIKQI
jgi:hypothetical protein